SVIATFDQVYYTMNQGAIREPHWFGRAGQIASLGGPETKTKLEMNWDPAVLLGNLLEPHTQIGADGLNRVHPNSVDCGSEILIRPFRNPLHGFVEHLEGLLKMHLF